MSLAGVDLVITCQDDLMRAIDARDVAAVEVATMALHSAVEKARAVSIVRDTGVERSRVEFALKQSDALRMRVNILSNWTRQRIDRLAEIRGFQAPDTYRDVRKSPEFGG